MIGYFLAIILISLSLLASGCSSKNSMMPTPHIYTLGNKELFTTLNEKIKTTSVEVFYVTDRKSEKSSEGIFYSHYRSPSIAFGRAVIELGERLTWEELFEYSTTSNDSFIRPKLSLVTTNELVRFPETPYKYRVVEDHDSIFITDAVNEQRKDAIKKAGRELSIRLDQTERKEIFLFVHGVNTTFQRAVEVVAEGYHFLGREGVPVVYTYPSGKGGFFNYGYDRESGEFTIFHFKNFLKFLSDHKGVEKINVIAHSRGTDVVLTAMRELLLENRQQSDNLMELFKFDNVILIAPDLDYEVVMQRVVAEGLVSMYERMTVYTNSSDQAINAATFLFDSWLRIGSLKQDSLSEEQQLTFNELTNLDIVIYQGSFGGKFGHNYFLKNPSVSSDILAVLRYKMLPGKEHGRPLKHLSGNFWLIDDNYPALPVE